MSLSVGEIAYANILPFFHRLKREELEEKEITFVRDVPSRVNAMLRKGDVDLAGISSFAYGENASDYVILPDLCVASRGKVGSLLLFSNDPIEELTGKRIALTTSSETTVHLLKVMLKRFYRMDVRYKPMAPDLDEMLEDNDAALLIGDDAIKNRNREVAHVYDLGEMWYNNTGLPMTYALFAVRKDVLFEKEQEVAFVQEALKDSYLKTHKDGYRQLSKDMSEQGDASRHYFEQYFHELKHEWDEEKQRGLLYYFRLVYEEGYMSAPVSDLEMLSGLHV
ncbi:menaquinone biosynthesis protein [Shouchella shacheensis]|uniref:menaquinone biosynthesis protein n=1 Tax=Shouchella shacheensis TaxID=1649580 RepID=UPI00073FE7FF|nr:menaquinone biosynthesis protein [Shouchella shacheensis]